MEILSEHFRILSALINIILGISIAFYIYHRSIKLNYPYIKYLIQFIILFNMGMVILFVGKYVELNLLDRLSPDLIRRLLSLVVLSFIFILFGIVYTILHLAWGLRNKTLRKRDNTLFLAGTAGIAVIHLIESIFFISLNRSRGLKSYLD